MKVLWLWAGMALGMAFKWLLDGSSVHAAVLGALGLTLMFFGTHEKELCKKPSSYHDDEKGM